MHASAEHLQMQLRYGQLRRLPTKAKASQAYTGAISAHGSARMSAGLGNGQAHQAASTQRGPQSTLSISFEPCVPYRVLVCRAACATVVKKIDWSKLTNYAPL